MINNFFYFTLIVILSGCGLLNNDDDYNEPAGWFVILSNSNANFEKTDAYQGIRVTNLYFLDKNNGWATGSVFRDGPNKAFAAVTTDGGRNWKFHFIDDYTSAGDPYFFDMQTGIIASSVIHKTTDGGQNWTHRMIRPDEPSYGVKTVTFVNESLGWAVGSFGAVAKTLNTGRTWEYLNLGYDDYRFERIHTIGEQMIWILGPEKLINSTNGGESWNQVELPSRLRYYDIYFFDEKNGWIGGDFRHLYSTSDGGVTWTLRYPLSEEEIKSDAIFAIDFLDKQNALAITSGGGILSTTDGGETWTVQRSDHNDGCGKNIQFMDENTAYATFGCKLYKTVTRGEQVAS